MIHWFSIQSAGIGERSGVGQGRGGVLQTVIVGRPDPEIEYSLIAHFEEVHTP